MKIQGKDLIFISQINRDGSGTHEVKADYIEMMQDEWFRVRCLSLSTGTYIANAFNSFVVKLKEREDKDWMSPMQRGFESYKEVNGDARPSSYFRGWEDSKEHTAKSEK
jgi:DNA-directed RNA polymerase subunit N (RpoN/RPB10)